MVERVLPKHQVEGSNPFCRSRKYGVGMMVLKCECGLAAGHDPSKVDYVGSIPIARSNLQKIVPDFRHPHAIYG